MPVGKDTDRTGQGRLPRNFDHFAGHGLYAGGGVDVFNTDSETWPITMEELTRAHGESVTLNEIAELTGHTYSNLARWSQRTDDFFPKAIPGTGKTSPTGQVSHVQYSMDEIAKWNDNFEPLKRGRKLVSRKAPTEEESTPKPYDPETDISRNLQGHMETFLSGGIDPDSKWPQRVATREEAPGWRGIHAPGPPPQVPVETGDPRPVEKTMPTEIPKSKKQKRAKDQRRKIEDQLKESKETDEGRDLEGHPGKKFW